MKMPSVASVTVARVAKGTLTQILDITLSEPL